MNVSDPVTARSTCKAWVCGRSLAGIAGSNPAEGVDVCLLCFVLSDEISAMCQALVQRSPTDCGVAE